MNLWGLNDLEIYHTFMHLKSNFEFTQYLWKLYETGRIWKEFLDYELVLSIGLGKKIIMHSKRLDGFRIFDSIYESYMKAVRYENNDTLMSLHSPAYVPP